MKLLIDSHEGITSFFKDNNDSFIPTNELVYIHTHPLMRPNFVTQIEQVVTETGELIIQKNLTGKPIEDLTQLAIKLGKLMPDLNADNAKEVCLALREIYVFCITLQRKLKK